MSGRVLEVGVGHYSMQSSYMRPRKHGFLYEEAAREAQLAEALGFDVFWLGEHHHAYDGYCPSLIHASAFLASRTNRIKLGSGILVLPHHNAERIAEASAAFQSIAPGRLRLTMGLGYWIDEFKAAGMEMSGRRAAAELALDRLCDGDLKERFGETELWLGGSSTPAFRRAAKRGLSVAIGANEKLVQKARSAFAESTPQGEERNRVVVFAEVWVDDNPRRIEWIKGRLYEMWRNYAINWVDDPSFRGLSPVESTEERTALREELVQKYSRFFVAGTPEEVVDNLAPLVEAGIDGIGFRLRFDGVGGAPLEHSMELLASAVVPELQKLAAGVRT